MIVTPETPADIAALVAANFPGFGGGRESTWGNPITAALKDKPACFAAGVDVQAVVDFILPLAAQIAERTGTDVYAAPH